MAENELLELKKNNLFRALNREGADYIPTILASSCAQIAWAGKTVADVIGDPMTYSEAMSDVLKVMWADANTFSGTLFTPNIVNIIEPVQNRFGPDGITPEHIQMPMMKEEDYDEFIRDPASFVTEVLVSRKYPKLFEDWEYAKETLRKIAEDNA